MAKNLNHLRVVFIFKNFGLIKGISHIGLGVASANTSETLKQHGIQTEVWSILTTEDLVEKIDEDHKKNHKKPTHIIISAPWVPTSLLAELTCKYPHIQFTVVSHSNVGFLAADRNGIKLLREEIILQQHVHNFQVAGNSKRFADWATVGWDEEVVFLPNLYNIAHMKLKRKQWNKKDTLRIGCFGAVRPLKNQITAAAAALAIARKLDVQTELWFNSGRNEGGSFSSMHTIEQLVGKVDGFKIRHMPWAPWDKFREFVGTMHLNLQPSYTESFNMVVADSVYESVPAVVSEAICWTPNGWVANSDDAMAIAKTGIELLQNPCAGGEGQEALREFVYDGIKAWKKYLLKK